MPAPTSPAPTLAGTTRQAPVRSSAAWLSGLNLSTGTAIALGAAILVGVLVVVWAISSTIGVSALGTVLTGPVSAEPEPATIGAGYPAGGEGEYAELTARWNSLSSLGAEYGDAKSGWLKDRYNLAIGSKSPQARENLAAEAIGWVSRFQAEYDAIADMVPPTSYANEHNQLIDIASTYLQRAEVYAEASNAAVSNPSREYWGSIQRPRSTELKAQLDEQLANFGL